MAAPEFPCLLGGSARPLGSAVSFLERPIAEVLDAVVEVRDECRVTDVGTMVEGLHALDPMESPWTRELLVDCGPWTAYVNNGRGGGDPTAIAPALARILSCRCVVAVYTQPYGPGHASTQFWLLGPDGEPPLYHVRTIAAHATDGRWRWYTSGTPQSYELAERYSRRRVRDRFDREMLISYLDHLEIRADDPEFFGRGVLVQQVVDWERTMEFAADFRRENGWD